MAGYVVVQDALEVGDDGVAFEGDGKFAIDVDGCLGFFEGSGQEMPMLACLDSPGPLTMQPMTASFISSTPG